MKRTLVFIKATNIKYKFKKIGEFKNPDTKLFQEAIEHKIYIPQEEVDSSVEFKSNKKMLCSFLSIRVIGEDKLMTFGTEDKLSIVQPIPLERKDFKAGELYAFTQAVVNYFKTAVPTEFMKTTHLITNGVINHDRLFGIHYTVLIPVEMENLLIEKKLARKSVKIGELKNTKDLLHEVSSMCIDGYKEMEDKNAEICRT